MAISTLYSAKRIEQQFHTGEEPVMVMCSDVNIYVCKYMRSSATAYKLACEFIGETVEEKLAQLFDEQWIVTIWNNFINCLNENIG